MREQRAEREPADETVNLCFYLVLTPIIYRGWDPSTSSSARQ